MATASNTSLLQIGDCLNSNDVGHVVLVTDLVYNSSGTLTSIEITEQTPPQLKRTWWTPSDLGANYGGYYGIYRYTGSVPAAPDGSTNSGSADTSGKYYPACSSSATTFYGGMSEIGITCDWELHQRIAAKNGITDFSGTADQNDQLLALLKAGQLLNPVQPMRQCTSVNLKLLAGKRGISLRNQIYFQCMCLEIPMISHFPTDYHCTIIFHHYDR